MKILAGVPTLASLGETHPEWGAWLGLLELARVAIDDPAWRKGVPDAPCLEGGLPLIAGMTFALDTTHASALLGALLERAGALRSGADGVAGVFEAAIVEDKDGLQALASSAGIDPAVFAAVSALAVMPLLQACRDAWPSSIPTDYRDAACPVCGAWATLAEARGVERQLRLRCGRCGADWAGEVVRCAFCGSTDHERLGMLVAEATGDTRKVETCAECRAYMKTIATLTACPPADVRVLDATTVDLDIAALEHGYARPSRRAQRFEVHVMARAPRGFLAGLARWRP